MSITIKKETPAKTRDHILLRMIDIGECEQFKAYLQHHPNDTRERLYVEYKVDDSLLGLRAIDELIFNPTKKGDKFRLYEAHSHQWVYVSPDSHALAYRLAPNREVMDVRKLNKLLNHILMKYQEAEVMKLLTPCDEVEGIECKECNNTLPRHTVEQHLNKDDPIHTCPH